MKLHRFLGMMSLAACLPLAAYAADTPAQGNEAVKDALAKKETDVDNTTLLKETLTSVDKQYSLLPKGKINLTYDLNYSYIGEQQIVTDVTSGQATLFSIENQNSHTVTNTVAVDYGLRNNLTGSVTLPIVSKYTENATQTGVSNTIGDIRLSARYQPFGVVRGEPAITFTGGLTLPTGTSPFKVVSGSGLATGNGVFAFSGGINFNHIVDPVALFGSLNLTLSRAANHLSQTVNAGGGSQTTITRVEPGPQLGFGAGFAYALSYTITTSVSFQESIADGSKLTFADKKSVKTANQTSGILNLGIGYRVSSKTTVNTSVGIGLTTSSPNISIDVSVPFSW
ncbi:transporter [Burkholderiaceae bacterium DAT-1]|nr:transporter [Burkholderiaceae bacterium DAT-1]